MEDGQYFKLALIEECKSCVWVFAGLIPGYLAAGYMYYAEYGGILEGNQIVLNNMLDQILNKIINHMEHGLYIGIALLLYIIVTVSSASVIWKCIKGGKG